MTKRGLNLVIAVSACVLLACGDDGGGSASADGTTDATDPTDPSTTSTTTATTTNSGSGPSTTDTTSPTSTSATESTTASTTDATDTGTATGTASDTDATGTETDTTGTGTGTTGGAQWGEWLLTSDQLGQAVRLLRVDLSQNELGMIDVICDDILLPMGVPQVQFTSLAFLDDVLYAVRNNFLMTVDPCLCEATLVGTFNHTGIAGIAVNSNDVMYGVSAGSDVLLEIDPQDASTQIITNFNFNVGNHGLTWSNAQVNELYFIEASTDVLRVLDGTDPSMEKDQVNLTLDFTTVGSEMHPGNEILYACSGLDDLYTVDIQTGQVDMLVDMNGYQPPCAAIGAPWGPVGCIPQ